jgi:hypothetical protein
MTDNWLPVGARSPDDPVYRLRDLKDVVKTRAPVADFWAGLHDVKKAMK